MESERGTTTMRALSALQIRVFWITAGLATLTVLVAFRTAFAGYFMLDDFGMLAIARFLDNPLEVFYREHIPGGLYYRPLGMLLWWVSERAFGAQAAAHYAINFILHLGVAGAFLAVMMRLGVNRWSGLAVAVAFACHPIGLGTTAWLSDRFDLLAALFGLLALHRALDLDDRHALRTVVASVGLLALSLLAKEIGLAFVAAVGVCWLSGKAGSSGRVRATAISSVLLLVVGYALVRSLVLPSPIGQSLFELKTPMQLFADGLVHWAGGWWDYLTGWQRKTGWKEPAALISQLLIAGLVVAGLFLPWSVSRWRLLLPGMVLFVAAAVLHWPLLGFHAIPFAQETSALDVVVNARFFYVAQLGFLMMLCGLLEPLWTARQASARVATLAIVVLILVWHSSAQHLVRQYRNETRTQQGLVDAALEQIRTLGPQMPGCQIYLLDTADWRFGWVSDEAIKATFPDLADIQYCLVQTEHTPWYHIVAKAQLQPRLWQPMVLAKGYESQATQPPIGNGHFLTLNLRQGVDAKREPGAYYLSWRGNRFVDVSRDVREGRLNPAFQCNRPSVQCP